MSYLKTLVITVTIAAILFSLFSIPPVLAAGSTQLIRNNGFRVFAFSPGPVGQFSSIFLTVAESSAGTDILFSYDTPVITGGSAFLTTTANVFQTNGLASATLSPVTLNACVAADSSGNCIFQPVTIQATWTGFGNPMSSGIGGHGGLVPSCSFIHQFNAHGNVESVCGFVEQDGGINRQATVTGTLNGQSLVQPSGDIGTFQGLVIIVPAPTTFHP